MSNESKIPNEDALWDELAAPAEPAPKAVPVRETKSEKPGKKIDGFFLTCMAGVAAVSVAVTLLVGGMMGGNTPAASGKPDQSAQLQALQEENTRLQSQVEMQQKTIVDLQNNLMEFMGTKEFLDNMTVPSTPDGDPANPGDPDESDDAQDILDKQIEAYEILTQIQNAYAEFDRETLAELIPEMDERLEYLSDDALNSYYTILEYMEQPSNG